LGKKEVHSDFRYGKLGEREQWKGDLMAARVHMPLKVTEFDANGSMSSVKSCKTYT
jgi:hypothetical protein